MAEESENSGGSLKSILIGLASTIALGVGGYVTKKLVGEEEAAPAPAAVTAPAPVINITTNNTQQQKQVASGGKTVIIKEKEAAPAKPKAKTAKEELEKDPQW
jgi:hypothetical protein